MSPSITSTYQLLKFGFHLGLGFEMYRQETFTVHYIKRVAKKPYTSYIRHHCLIMIHFQKEFSLYESDY